MRTPRSVEMEQKWSTFDNRSHRLPNCDCQSETKRGTLNSVYLLGLIPYKQGLGLHRQAIILSVPPASRSIGLTKRREFECQLTLLAHEALLQDSETYFSQAPNEVEMASSDICTRLAAECAPM